MILGSVFQDIDQRSCKLLSSSTRKYKFIFHILQVKSLSGASSDLELPLAEHPSAELFQDQNTDMVGEKYSISSHFPSWYYNY